MEITKHPKVAHLAILPDMRPCRRNAEQLFPMDPVKPHPSEDLVAFLDKVEDICCVLTERLGDHINITGELLMTAKRRPE